MQGDLVSVIIPCFNHEEYVKTAIESVIFQTHKRVELKVVDDGSSYRSPEVISSLADKYGFKFIRQSNLGICKTLNKAIRLSQGHFIAILASDDYWYNEKLEKQLGAMASIKDCQFSFSQVIEFDNNNGSPKRIFPAKPLSGRILNSFFLRHMFLPAQFCLHEACLIKLAVLTNTSERKTGISLLGVRQQRQVF